MSGFIKYFENNKEKNMSFLANDDDDNDDDVILNITNSVEFDSQPDYDRKYIKTRIKTFEDKVITKMCRQ